jgi:hypothetical protein
VEGKEASPGACKHVGFGGSGRGSGRIWAQRLCRGGLGSLVVSLVVSWGACGGAGERRGDGSSCRHRLRKDDIQKKPHQSTKSKAPADFSVDQYFRCGETSQETHLWAPSLAGAAETSPYAISHYFVWRREGP